MSYGSNSLKTKYIPRNPGKYRGNVKDIFLRSSWELKLAKYLDLSNNVIAWSSETTVIGYRSPLDGEEHRYFVDFKCWIRGKDNTVNVFLVEVKPKSMCSPPKEPKRKTKTYVDAVKRWLVNEAKWKAARKYCEMRGFRFVIFTEDELQIKK